MAVTGIGFLMSDTLRASRGAGPDDGVKKHLSQSRQMSSKGMAGMSDTVFIRRVFIVAAVALLLFVLWLLSQLLLLIFGSVLIAVILRTLAEPVAGRLRINEGWALTLVGLALIAILAAAMVLFGATLRQQWQGLSAQVSMATTRIAEQIGLGSMEDLLKSDPATSLGAIAMRLFAWSSTFLGALTGTLLVLFGAIYLAANPQLYLSGFLKLIPSVVQPPIAAALNDAHEALRRWLGAQLIAMILVGALVGIGLTILGLPSALALGIIAGLAEFVPIVGPALAAIPILLVAGAQDWQTLLWALAIIVIVQQLESNLITPLIVGQTVAVAPAVALFAIVAIGMLFGPLGLLFGFPLAVVIDIAVRRLYVADTLGKDVEIMGKHVDGN
jgi:predicted PurR-regulated permease PerM